MASDKTLDKKHTFTDSRLLNKIELPEDNKRSYYYDTKQPGLRLQVTAAGTKSFQFQSRGKSGIQTRTLGRYPKISLKQARKQCAELQGLVNNGVDVVAEAKRTREEYTLDSLFTVWLDEHAKPHKKTWSEDEKTYNRRIKKTFGKKNFIHHTDTSTPVAPRYHQII